jgi:hypothetical protein
LLQLQPPQSIFGSKTQPRQEPQLENLPPQPQPQPPEPSKQGNQPGCPTASAPEGLHEEAEEGPQGSEQQRGWQADEREQADEQQQDDEDEVVLTHPLELPTAFDGCADEGTDEAGATDDPGAEGEDWVMARVSPQRPAAGWPLEARAVYFRVDGLRLSPEALGDPGLMRTLAVAHSFLEDWPDAAAQCSEGVAKG